MKKKMLLKGYLIVTILAWTFTFSAFGDLIVRIIKLIQNRNVFIRAGFYTTYTSQFGSAMIFDFAFGVVWLFVLWYMLKYKITFSVRLKGGSKTFEIERNRS